MTNSARIQENILEFLSDQLEHSVQDIKTYLAEINIGKYSEGQFAGSINTLLRNGSIIKIARGIYSAGSLEGGQRYMKTCFVVSPIGNPGSEIRNNADKLFKHIIKPICENCSFEAIRVDQLNDSSSITHTIIEKLETTDLVIADISGHNPNVFYEIGFRTRTKRPIIYLKAKGETLPFDITTIRTFDYDLTDLDSVDEVKDRLEQTIKSISFPLFENEQTGDEGVIAENAYASVMPVLYQILDSVAKLQEEVKSNNSDIIQTVIKTMQSTQPQMSAEAALQAQLLSSAMQNPENLLKLVEMTDKLPKKYK